MTEAELNALLRTSPQAGYRAMFDQYFRYVYAIVFRTLRGCGTPEDVEECVIDTFAEVMLRVGDIRPESLKSYIGTTAKHKALNLRRTLAADRERRTDILSELPSPQQVEEEVEQSELSRILLQSIRALGEPDATILLQKYYYDRTSGEIARITGLSAVAVRKRCSRAVKKLKEQLADYHLRW